MGGLALITSSKLLAFNVHLFGWAKYNAIDQMKDIPAFEKGNMCNRKIHYNNIRYNMSALSVFIYIESRKYCGMKIVERVRLFIYDKVQLRYYWYLTSMKRIFVMGGCYFFVFSRNIARKKITSFSGKGTCADLTEYYNNMELKTFRKTMGRKFFSDLISWE